MVKLKNVEKIIKILKKRYKVKVRKEHPFRVLIHGILSSRTKDDTTFPAQDRLLKAASTPEKILKLSAKQIEKLIYPVGFYRTKSKRVREACKLLIKKFGGKVPKKREQLMEIPGVGGKISDIVMLFGFGKDVVPVDSHVAWVSNQLKWTNSSKPEKIREDLHKLFPEKQRPIVNQLLVQHGREVCNTGRPKCEICPIEKYCPSSRLKHPELR